LAGALAANPLTEYVKHAAKPIGGDELLDELVLVSDDTSGLLDGIHCLSYNRVWGLVRVADGKLSALSALDTDKGSIPHNNRLLWGMGLCGYRQCG